MKYLLVALLIIFGSLPSVWAAQLDADIGVDDDTINPTFSFLRIIYIEYPEGGEIAQLLNGKNQTISFTADSSTNDMKPLVNQINQNLDAIPSTVVVTDTVIEYQAILNGNQDSAAIELKLQLIPTITNPIINEMDGLRVIDANWRGLTLDSPIIFDTSYGTFDVNNPKDVLKIMIPEVMDKLDNSNMELLEIPLVNSSEILKLPLHRWHSLFDNTAIIASAEQFNFTGKHVLTHYSMGECNLESGFCQDRKWIQDLELDKKYKIVMIESRDDASITIEGYSNYSRFGMIETFRASLSAPVDKNRANDEFPATVMYGMAGLAAVGGVGMFIISNRRLRKDQDQGQTGIDPANLRAYEISTSAGGYKTNRGEAVLINKISKMPV